MNTTRPTPFAKMRTAMLNPTMMASFAPVIEASMKKDRHSCPRGWRPHGRFRPPKSLLDGRTCAYRGKPAIGGGDGGQRRVFGDGLPDVGNPGERADVGDRIVAGEILHLRQASFQHGEKAHDLFSQRLHQHGVTVL